MILVGYDRVRQHVRVLVEETGTGRYVIPKLNISGHFRLGWLLRLQHFRSERNHWRTSIISANVFSHRI